MAALQLGLAQNLTRPIAISARIMHSAAFSYRLGDLEGRFMARRASPSFPTYAIARPGGPLVCGRLAWLAQLRLHFRAHGNGCRGTHVL